jgi:hypothetical protein
MYCIPPHLLTSLLFHYLLYSPAPSLTRLTYCLPSFPHLLACFPNHLVPLSHTYMPALSLTHLFACSFSTYLLACSLPHLHSPLLPHLFAHASSLTHLLACSLPRLFTRLLPHLLACFFSLSLTLLLPSSVVYPPTSSKLN